MSCSPHRSKRAASAVRCGESFVDGVAATAVAGWTISPDAAFFGAAALTAITDNAAPTYLASLVPGLSDEFKYMILLGAVTDGGLTVIANAPNPTGYAMLKGSFEEIAIGAGGLLLAALPPTLVAAFCL